MKKQTALLFVSVSIWLGAGQLPVFAAHDDLEKPLKHVDDMKGEGAHVHDYDDIVSAEMESAWSLANRARTSLRNGNVSRALSLIKRAMDKDDDDMDIHLIYAQAMQAKLERQTERDPELFKKCIHEFIIVYRNEVGMEKGMTFKGLNPMGNLYNDDEHGNLAKKQLIKLTGYAPKLWETDNHYMARVSKPAETSVSAKLKSSGANSDKGADDDKPVVIRHRPQTEE